MRNATIIFIAFALYATAFASDDADSDEFSPGTVVNLSSDFYPSPIIPFAHLLRDYRMSRESRMEFLCGGM